MSGSRAIQLHLSLKGEPVKSYEFDQDVVMVGRSPSADIFIDNPGISRNHLRIDRLAGGEYLVSDLGSANGTFVNDVRVQTGSIRNEDVVAFGKYSLLVGLSQEPATTAAAARRDAGPSEGATVVLSPAEVRQMIASARSPEPASTPAAAMAHAHAPAHSHAHPAAPPAAKPFNMVALAITLTIVAVVIGIGAFLLTR